MSDKMKENDLLKTRRWTLAATILTSGVAFLSGSVINVALPVIGESLNARLSELQWVVDAYILTLASLLIVGGALGDRFGRRRMSLIGLAGFGLSLVACGLAPDIHWLIGLRAIQGLAGAMMVPESLAIIRSVFEDPEGRGRAIGAWSGWTGIAAVIGPLLGGWVVESLSWRWAFFLSLPLIGAAAWLMIRFVPESQERNKGRPIDLAGAGLVTLGLGGLSFGVIEGPVVGWASPRVLIALVVGGVSLAVFPCYESRIDHPMLPLEMFREKNFVGANLTTLAVYAALMSTNFLLVLYIQNVMGFSALEAGLMLAPTSILLLLLSSFFGRLSSKYGPRLFMTFGPILSGVGLVLMSTLTPETNIWWSLIPMVILFGLGLSVTVAPLTNTVMSAVMEEHSAVGAAFNNMVSRVAGLLAVAGLGAVLSLGFSRKMDHLLTELSLPAETAGQLRTISEDPAASVNENDLPDTAVQAYQTAYTTGFQQAMGVGAGLAIAGGLVAFVTIQNKDTSQSNQVDEKERI